MQMMFFYLFLITIFFTTKNSHLGNRILLDDDLFYETPYQLHMSNNKNNNQKDEISKNSQKTFLPTIKNLNDFFNINKINLLKTTDFIIKSKGKCLNFYNLYNLYDSNKNKTEIQNNLESVSNFLNDFNFIHRDEYGNLLIYSICKNSFFFANTSSAAENENYVRCFQKFVFISKIDFSYYSFSFSGDKLPILTNFSVDFAFDEFAHKRYLFIFGGIDSNGNHNSEIFRYDIDYIFGNINVKKITFSESNIRNLSAPQGLSDSSFNTIRYDKENLSYKKNFISVVFGGNNDEKISNKFYIFKHETSNWIKNEINNDLSIIPRKGHSAVISTNFLLEGEYVNKELIKTYNLIIFGGKSENAYLNDVSVIKIDYVVLDDNFFFKYTSLLNGKDIIGNIPEPREGHKSFIEGHRFFIYGGCNYTIKKCYYDSFYILDLNKKPYKWERIALVDVNAPTNEENKINFNNLKTGEKMSNFITYKNTFISIGSCLNYESCKNDFNIFFDQSECAEKNISIKEKPKCKLSSFISDYKFDWEFNCLKQDKNSKMIKQNLKIKSREIRLEDENSEWSDNLEKQIKNLIIQNKLNTLFKIDEEKEEKNSSEKKEEENKKNVKFKKSFIQRELSKEEEIKTDKNASLKYDKDDRSLNEKLRKFIQEKILKDLLDSENPKEKNENNSLKFKNRIKENKSMKNRSKISSTRNIMKLNKIKNESISTNDLIKIQEKTIEKIEQKISENFRNSSNLLFKKYEDKFENFINKSQSLNTKYLEGLIDTKFKKIESDNTKLKKLIYINQIKPLVEEHKSLNISNEEINFLNFEEKISNITENIKEKNKRKFQELKKNSVITNNIQANISEIKKIISKESYESKKIINDLIRNLMRKIENFDNTVDKKLHRIDDFIINQAIINNSTKEFFQKQETRKSKVTKVCFNGFLINETFCQCHPGFSGENCEFILTCEDQCSQNGICQFGKCFCNPGFMGSKCEKKQKCPNDCNNNGKCYLGKCYCDYGFSGLECENKMKCSNDCSNKGICFRGKCLCESGFTGEDCSQIAVKFNSCKNNCNKNGLCKIEKCFCYPGFSGKYCEIKNKFSCPSTANIYKNNTENLKNITFSPCSGNGLCKYGMCFCYPGFKGMACEHKELCKNNCNNNGICVNGKCVCKNKLKTDDCSEENHQLEKFSQNSKKNKKSKDNEFKNFHFVQINRNENKLNNKTFQYNVHSDKFYDKKFNLDEFTQKIVNELKKNKTIVLDGVKHLKEIDKKNPHYSIIDESSGVKYEYNPEGIYIGKEIIDKMLYSGVIVLSIIFSILLTMYLNGKFSK